MMRVDLVTLLAGATFFAFLWALAALHKALNWSMYRDQLRDYRVLPEAAVFWFALLLPIVEAALAFSWLFDDSRGWAVMATAVLLLAYAAAMAYNLMHGRDSIDCGCGGAGQAIRWGLVTRNLVLAVAAISLGLLEPVALRPLLWMDYVTIAAAALAIYAFYIICNQLLANNPPQRWVR